MKKRYRAGRISSFGRSGGKSTLRSFNHGNKRTSSRNISGLAFVALGYSGKRRPIAQSLTARARFIISLQRKLAPRDYLLSCRRRMRISYSGAPEFAGNAFQRRMAGCRRPRCFGHQTARAGNAVVGSIAADRNAGPLQ